MKVLVTGSAGFIGRHLVSRLKHDGHQVLGIDPRNPVKQDARNWFRTDRNKVHRDLVIHCAAVVGGRQLIETPLAHAANLELDARLFQWAEWAQPGRIVYISSVAAYPVHLQQGVHELLHLGTGMPGHIWPMHTEVPAHILREKDVSEDYLMSYPDELYGWAKLTGELLAARSSVPVSIPRPFTVYGEGQDEIFPFANIMQQIRERKDPVTVWGSGNQVRDFIHVEDVVNGIIAMAEQEIAGPVNFCTGIGTNLNELIGMMTKAAGYSPEIEHLDKTEGLPYRVGDASKLHEFYEPKISLQQGIERGLR